MDRVPSSWFLVPKFRLALEDEAELPGQASP